jgi:hypothetical protein
MKEYLGEDEPTLSGYILKRLANKASPQEIMEKIRLVFEEDTEVYFYLILGICEKALGKSYF